MSRRILLLEPNYQNKYPPVGLMKLAMYHRLQGDSVVFFKGDFPRFVLTELTRELVETLCGMNRDILFLSNVNWQKLEPDLFDAIKTGTVPLGSELEGALATHPFAEPWLKSFRKQYRTGGYFNKPRWDRVCVTTLFTFYWDITIETIEFAKKVCKDIQQVFVGGILASVIPDKVEKVTGIRPHVGCLNVTKLPGDKPLPAPHGKTFIDALPLDYSIIEEIDYQYPAIDAYYGYATRGCVNKCPFCAVPILEPDYIDYIPLKRRLEETRDRFGEQRHLLLLDNNAFASKNFAKIIDEIRDSGFGKGATFVPPNQLDIAIKQLRDGWNDRAYTKLAIRLLSQYVEKLEGEKHDKIYSLLMNNGLLHHHTATKETILRVYDEIKEEYEKACSKRPVVRFIDFNQGMDARLATSENMAKLATVAIRPLRIAFDTWSIRQHYVNAVNLAKENGILQMSNYLLYNFKDKPVDLYRRLLLNIDLCDKLGVNIYSFPMKYHPIMDEKWFSNRDFIGSHWTRKTIRTVQSILNSTHGKIGRGRTFFFKAFGRDENEFAELLRMPEAFIIKRWDAELSKLTEKWSKAYYALSTSERSFVDGIVDTNNVDASMLKGHSPAIRKVLEFYMIKREDIPLADEDSKNRKIAAFENSCPTTISEECRRLLRAVGVTLNDN